MKKLTKIYNVGKKRIFLLAGMVGLNVGVFTMSLPDVHAFASYDPMVYYSDVVKSNKVLNALDTTGEVNSSDENMIMDHTECWGTRDCIEVIMPEDGTLKLHMKNTSGYWMYGSTLEVYTNKNLSHKLGAASISVDGGGEGDSSIYLEKGTYYIFVSSQNYEGNEFVEGEPHLSRRTQVWAGYVAQEAIFSVQSVELSGDKSSATITLNLPEKYSTLRVEDYYIDYEYLKNSATWETDSRANMIEYNTYTVKENGWYTFRLTLSDEDKSTKGWGYLCHVKVEGINGNGLEELVEQKDNLPEAEVDGEIKTIASVTGLQDMKNRISQETEPIYSVHAYRQTVKNITITMKEAGTLCLTGFSQANQGSYKTSTLTLYADKKKTMKLGSTEVSGMSTVTWSLLPGTYYLTVKTSPNSSELNDTEYAERSLYLYAGCITSKQVMSQDISLSKDKSSATIQLNFANALKGVNYKLYDYKVNKWQISNGVEGNGVTVENNTLKVTQNGEYTIYVKGIGSKDYPVAYIDTFCVSGINGEEYTKETKEAPGTDIPYAHSISELLDNVVAGQEPFISIPYLAWDYGCSANGNISKYKKIVFEEDTYVYAFAGGNGGYVKFYKDFQCTDLYKSLNADSNVDCKNIKAGTYYVYFQSKVKSVGSYDGAYCYAQAQLYLSGVKNSDLLKISELQYDEKKTQVSFSPYLINNEKIGNVYLYNKHYERGGDFADEYCVGTTNGNMPISIKENGEYTVVVYPKNAANMGTNTILYHVNIDDLVEQSQEDSEEKKPEDGEKPGEGTNTEDETKPGEGTDTEDGANIVNGDASDAEESTGNVKNVKEEQSNTETGNNNNFNQNIVADGEGNGSSEQEEKNDKEDSKVQNYVQVRKGSIVDVKGLRYKVTGTTKTATVCFSGVDKKGMKSIVVPNSIKIQGKTYIVTEFAKNALKGNNKMTSLTIGKNVTKIGKNAMDGCKNLKKITVKSTKLKAVGANAFKGTGKKVVIKVPQKKRDKYKEMFKKAGISKSVIYK